jgi:hypothetical protein
MLGDMEIRSLARVVVFFMAPTSGRMGMEQTWKAEAESYHWASELCTLYLVL